mmetsp:Transcript_2529/g.3587  ORF Transcript_2529/g.3587 Transcript_2529/m.3587 type:complete len:82 (-) Transcript_2529:118-363(-)|eukprot:CAMPEP_0202466456 /NCGR_PEP_ID=MMETSP1360-20130828/68831_1 /ASSEMBLY_ACC=CAM_ASM_000848 /TAXON_ID=515479 /ORGANISM="Licmophora paradoxa, Strain CCMP2313" /LENGTH=81 /DNA_ID=CAMNT_0049090599 /DNA_START=69 /DNA_END=314 /DNA_ORIENTATION=+
MDCVMVFLMLFELFGGDDVVDNDDDDVVRQAKNARLCFKFPPLADVVDAATDDDIDNNNNWNSDTNDDIPITFVEYNVFII